MRRQIFALLLCGFLLASCLSVGAVESQEGTLIIEYPYGGAEFELFLVAVGAATGEIIPTEDFDSYPLHWEGEGRELALTLQGYIMRDRIRPLATAVTDETGHARFDQLEEGYYLILGEQLVDGEMVAFSQPSMVMMPLLQGEEAIYHVRIKPKHEQRHILGSMSIHVLKLWDDNQYPQRPTEVTVDLLCDGEIWDTVVLSGANNWRYTWEDLPSKHLWTLAEREPEDYSVELSRDEESFTITNRRLQEPPPTKPDSPPDIPQTGMLWWPVPVLASVGLVLIAWGWLRRRRSMEES